MTYDDFLNNKVCIAEDSGFDVADDEINPKLKPHQREAVKWACKGGRRALFESFGLGKTVQELEFCRLVLKHEGGRALLVLPFGGLMTVPYTAVKMNRRGYGIELNADYFRDGVGYLKSAEEQYDTPTLFDFISVGA